MTNIVEIWQQWIDRNTASNILPLSDGLLKRLVKEEESIRQRREASMTPVNELKNLAGLAISGGGIRSATFALGVLQSLGKTGVLNQVDYLSTVS